MGNTRMLAVAAAVAAVAAISAAANAQAPMAARTLTPEEIAELAKTMPEGPNRELTVRVCAGRKSVV